MIAGCSDRLDVADNQLVPDGEMAVNLGVEGPMTLGTRSYVNGTEEAISTIKMLCFDAGGAYISSRNASLTPTTATTGKITGSVPANTARIHFVANFGNLDLSSLNVGTLERVVMKNSLLSSGVHDQVRFWGYHKENTSSAMSDFLNASTPNTIKLLRDRAKVVVVNNDRDIASIRWTISYGLKRGFVAAASSADNNNPFDNNYVSSTILTEYRSSDVYDEDDSDYMESTDIWADENEPQYLFENANSTVPVKVIVEATFNNGTKRYHTILLQDKQGVQYRVLRNQTFTLTLLDLPPASETTIIGSDTFEEAVATTNYSNNPYAQVDREVNEISNGEFTLAVENVMVIYNSGTTGTVNFTYRRNDGNPVTQTNFNVSWEPKADDDPREDVAPVTTNPTVTYNGTTGQGTITFSLNQITSDLKYNSLQIVSPSGLTRYVDVYSITAFSYTSAFEKVSGTTWTTGGVAHQVYKLTLTIPADVPQDVYPLKVRMYTNTLAPYSDNTAGARSGSFDVITKTTEFLTGTDAVNQWNWDANNWGFWYEYSVKYVESETPLTYTIYLYDRCSDYVSRPNIATVGLFLEIPNFGGRRQYYENR